MITTILVYISVYNYIFRFIFLVPLYYSGYFNLCKDSIF